MLSRPVKWAPLFNYSIDRILRIGFLRTVDLYSRTRVLMSSITLYLCQKRTGYWLRIIPYNSCREPPFSDLPLLLAHERSKGIEIARIYISCDSISFRAILQYFRPAAFVDVIIVNRISSICLRHSTKRQALIRYY
jgi:hypothetical protein